MVFPCFLTKEDISDIGGQVMFSDTRMDIIGYIISMDTPHILPWSWSWPLAYWKLCGAGAFHNASRDRISRSLRFELCFAKGSLSKLKDLVRLINKINKLYEMWPAHPSPHNGGFKKTKMFLVNWPHFCLRFTLLKTLLHFEKIN